MLISDIIKYSQADLKTALNKLRFYSNLKILRSYSTISFLLNSFKSNIIRYSQTYLNLKKLEFVFQPQHIEVVFQNFIFLKTAYKLKAKLNLKPSNLKTNLNLKQF